MIYNLIKYSLLTITTLLVMSSCNKNGGANFTMNGQLENLKQNYFLASRESAGDTIIVDTIYVNSKGEFKYEGKVDTLRIMSLYFDDDNSISIFVNKGWETEVSGDIKRPDLIQVKGGEVNDDLSVFKKKNRGLLEAKAKALIEIDNIQTSSTELNSHAELKNLNFELINIAREYIKENPSKIASVMLIQDFYKNNTSIDVMDRELDLLQGEAAGFYLTKELKAYSERVRKSLEGAIAPNFTLKDINNKTVSITDFKGKYLLLSYASISCSLCEELKPLKIEVYKKIKDQKINVEFVTVLLDSDVSLITKEITDPVHWIILPDSKSWGSEAANLYNITEIPYNILISPEGVILQRNISITTLIDKLKELETKK